METRDDVGGDVASPPLRVLPSPSAAYVHVPFCVHRCGYCDFTVLAGRDDLAGAYLDALEVELTQLGRPRPVETVFIGGGTPTHLRGEELSRLLGLVREWFPFRSPGAGEWSVEANPADLDVERLDALGEAGVTRVSLGVQSFDAAVLKTLERDHSPERAERAVGDALERFADVSLDLIFGVPGQSIESWRNTLERAVATGVPHISAYGLTFEKGTAFWTRRLKGDLAEPPDETQRMMYGLAMDVLPAAGLEQYELSNYARPGHRCRHNEAYWRGDEFFGVGPGAASLVNGVRRTNHRSATTYIRRLLAGESAVMDEEPFEAETRAHELIMTGLRTADGLPRERVVALSGRPLDEEAVARCVAAGWLDDDGARVRLTREGRFVADVVVAEFF